jgi:hypothetical protein
MPGIFPPARSPEKPLFFKEICMTDVTQSVIERGDLAHLALFMWASGASGLLMWSLRELAAANRRFDGFVRELANFNRQFGEG